MNKIYKIFLGLALFLALTGVAWAGFNYESAKNCFLIDSFLNASGNYILVGSALNALPANASALAISNNLIFLNDTSQFTDYSVRQIAKNDQGYYFSTPNITIHSDSDFRIAAPGRAGFLSLISKYLKIYQDFYAKNGLNIATGLTTLAPKTIAVNKVLATNLSGLSSTDLNSPAQAVLYLPALAGSETKAVSSTTPPQPIKFAGGNLCETITWDDAAAQKTNNARIGVTAADDSLKAKHTCDQNYFVFDMDANLGILVCCKITSPAGLLDINKSF